MSKSQINGAISNVQRREKPLQNPLMREVFMEEVRCEKGTKRRVGLGQTVKKERNSRQEKKSEQKHEVEEGQGMLEEHEQTILLKERVCKEQ